MSSSDMDKLIVKARFYGTVGRTQSTYQVLEVDANEWKSIPKSDREDYLISHGTSIVDTDDLSIDQYGELEEIEVTYKAYNMYDNNDTRNEMKCRCGHDFYKYTTYMPDHEDPSYCPNCGTLLNWDVRTLTREQSLASLKSYTDNLVQGVIESMNNSEDKIIYYVETNLRGVLLRAVPITTLTFQDYVDELEFKKDVLISDGRSVNVSYYHDIAGNWEELDQFLSDGHNGNCNDMLSESQKLLDDDIRDDVYMEWWRTTDLGYYENRYVGLLITDEKLEVVESHVAELYLDFPSKSRITV